MNTHQPATLRSIIYFGNGWAGANRTSSHHIADELSKQYDVHYFECPGLRAPTSSSRDLRRIVEKLYLAIMRPRRIAKRLTVYSLLQLPFHRFSVVRRINSWLSRTQVRLRLRGMNNGNAIIWCTVPHVAALANALPHSIIVYYCIDDYSALPGVDVNAVRAMDDALTRSADVVFVASDTLLESKRRLNDNTHLNPHGVDVHHFATALNNAEPPADIANVPRPIVGFFGLIERWIDLDLIEYIARERPDWSVVMIGRVVQEHQGAMNCPNVHFLGQRDYSLLPRYGSSFDVCMLPHRLTRFVLHANPLKLREYLAMGKPVVSVPTPEVNKFSDLVRIADTYAGFVNELDLAIATVQSPADVLARVEKVSKNGWDAQVQNALQHVEKLVSKKQGQ